MDLRTRLAASPTHNQWEKVAISPHHGIDIPLFSLHSEKSGGIGEFTDLLPLIPWCKSVGFDILMLLPLNDTGCDTSPYSALSAFALNPIHLGLASLPQVDKISDLQSMLKDLRHLNEAMRVDYPRVQMLKESFLREYYRLFGESIKQSDAFASFLSQNKWLSDYALFKAIKIERKWQPWEEWDEKLRDPTQEERRELYQQYAAEISFHQFVQFLCFQQMEGVKRAAEEQGILIKGDIPILISRESADVWRHRSLFLLQYSAGAPPDMYNSEGQNWGFPLYNWPILEQQHYGWWRERLAVASRFYHLYRIDHIIGFFRIWAIPPGLKGNQGHFIPEDRSTWIPKGKRVLQMMLDSSSMLPIGEDLGDVPPEVRICMEEMGICGTKVMRWERYWNGDQSFIPYANYSPLSMTTVSTHDSEPLQVWWESHPEEARAFAAFKRWPYTAQLSKENHLQILRDSHQTASLFHINLIQEYVAMVPSMTWPDPDSARINVPGVISEKNWSNRVLPSVEEIVTSKELRGVMQQLLA